MGRPARRPLLRVDILSLFPGMFEGPLSESILKRARERGLLEVSVTDPRDFAEGRHRPVDDRPYGGGVGMVLMAEPLHRALAKVRRRGALVVALTPAGRRFDQALARELSRRRRLVLVCGRYEGIDQRLLDRVDLELSIGDYVLTGGELPAMVVVDAVARLVPGVLAKEEAALRDSFSEPLLEHPHYTRPRVWRGKAVPAVLLSGDHRAIADWRRRQAEARTRGRRPDLLRKML